MVVAAVEVQQEVIIIEIWVLALDRGRVRDLTVAVQETVETAGNVEITASSAAARSLPLLPPIMPLEIALKVDLGGAKQSSLLVFH